MFVDIDCGNTRWIGTDSTVEAEISGRNIYLSFNTKSAFTKTLNYWPAPNINTDDFEVRYQTFLMFKMLVIYHVGKLYS